MPEKRLHAKLAATSAITDLVGTRIGPEWVRQGVTNPKIVYSRASTEPINHSTGTCATRFCTIHVDCIADTYPGAQAVATVVRAALNGWTDATGSPDIGMTHQEDEFDTSPTIIGGSDTGPTVITQSYLIQYTS